MAGDVIEIWKPIQTEVGSVPLPSFLESLLIFSSLPDTESTPGVPHQRGRWISLVAASHRFDQRGSSRRQDDAGSVEGDLFFPSSLHNPDPADLPPFLQPIFRLIDSDNKVTSRFLKRHDDELNRALRSSVPGLVNLSSDASSVLERNNNSDDRFASSSTTGAGPASHRLLVTPDAFNVSILFQPTLSFLKRAAAIMPVGIEDESSGLDEFVIKVYLPQLEEKVSDLVQSSLGGGPSLSFVPSFLLELT